MSQRMYSQGKKNFKGLEYEGGGSQGCMTTFLFVPLRSKNVPSVFSPANIFRFWLCLPLQVLQIVNRTFRIKLMTK